MESETGKTEQGELELEEPATMLDNVVFDIVIPLDCEICGERLGVRDVWRKGAWFGRLCPDCEREGRRGVSRSKAPGR